MRLTVTGSAASWAGSGHACSGYLVEHDGTRILLDCGNGSLANAATVTDVTSLDAVFVSHGHPDHFADLYALQAALRFAPDGPVGSVPLHLPEGLWDRLGALLSEHGREQLAAAFQPVTLAAGESIRVGEVTVTPWPVEHDGATFAFAVDAGGARLVYTSDTRLGDPARAAVRDADVVLAECTLPDAYAGRAPHMTAAEAAELADGTGAGLLLLTHLWPSADHDVMLATARDAFRGEVRLASELMTVDVEAVETEEDPT